MGEVLQAPEGSEDARRGGGAAGAGEGGAGLRVQVRFFAGAAAAAGLDEEVVLLEDDATLGVLLGRLRDAHPALGPVLEVASTLVDEVAVTDPGARLRAGGRVDVLPPFAGG